MAENQRLAAERYRMEHGVPQNWTPPAPAKKQQGADKPKDYRLPENNPMIPVDVTGAGRWSRESL
jgi:hypothetical protein